MAASLSPSLPSSEADTSASYGAMDTRPPMANGGPMMDPKPAVVSIQLHSPPSPHMNRSPVS